MAPALRKEWTVTDPGAPDRPAVTIPAVPSTVVRPPRSRRRGGTGLVGVAVAVLVGTNAPVLCKLAAGCVGWMVSGRPWAISDGAGTTIGVVVLASTVLVVLAQATSGLRWRRRQRRAEHRAGAATLAAGFARIEHADWAAQHQVRRDELPAGPLRAAADRLFDAVGALERTRAHRDGWIGAEAQRGLRARRWSLLSRLRDSVAVRAQLAESATLAGRTPELDRVAAQRRGEIDALDAELAATTGQLEQLVAEAHALDEALAADAAARAERERADALAVQLGATPATVEEMDLQHRRIRDQLLAGTADTDPAILGAQLRALTRHLTGTAEPGTR
jgi:hypothetical protein